MTVPDAERDTESGVWDVRPLTPRDAPESEDVKQSASNTSASPPVRPVGASPEAEGWCTRGERYTGPESSLVWVGTHGGAGVTALADASELPAVIAGGWPDPGLGWPESAVLVARASARGVEALQRPLTDVARDMLPDGLALVAVVVVADGPKLPPRSVRGSIRTIHGVAPVVLHLPWIPEWRAAPGTPTRASNRLITKIQALQPKAAPIDNRSEQDERK